MAEESRRFDPKKCDKLLSEERWAKWNPPVLFAAAGVREGMAVLDLGCGPGFWTLPLAEIVGPGGQVVALDVSQELLDALMARTPPPQVWPFLGELPAIGLPDASVDFIWAAFVYHEVENPSALVSEMRRVLRPEGTVAVLDWRPDAVSENGPPRSDRVAPEDVAAALEMGGLRNSAIVWKDEDTYRVEARA